MTKKIPRVGVFDSGIGGLSILKEISRFLPEKELFYIADQAYCPYGDRTSEEIKNRCVSIVEELLEKKVDLVLIACNTATVTALSFLKTKFDIPLLGVEPRIDYAGENNLREKNSLLVLTTPVTGNSQRFQELKQKIDPEGRIEHLNCPKLAKIVENFFDDSSIKNLRRDVKKEFASLKGKKFSHVVLGCTHYEHIPSVISEILGGQTVGSGVKAANRVSELVFKMFPGISLGKLSHEENRNQKFHFKSTAKGLWEQKEMKSWMDRVSL